MDFNPYIYARNNPFKYVDRNGEIGILAIFGLGFLVGGTVNVAFNWENIHNVGDFCGFFAVGGTAGVIGTAAAVMAPAGFLAGALCGQQEAAYRVLF